MIKTIREQQEAQEQVVLSPYACLSSRSRGRMNEEEHCHLRTAFQRDRDRIIHSKTFRRLKHKTQVFLAPAGDHYRTRLTHVLEVSQIARTMAVCLRLNEYLTEAIALGHDLGHTPFGHAGEFSLNQLHPRGFKHYRQSLRIVDFLENGGHGLNLTWEVRNGILKHSKGYGEILPGDTAELAATLEGQLVRVADIMAYVNHDMDDALRGGMLANEDLPAHLRAVLGDRSSQRINAMVGDLVATTLERNDGRLHLSGRMNDTINELRSFLYDNVYRNYRVHNEFEKAQRIIRDLYGYFLEHEPPENGLGACCRASQPVQTPEEERRRHRQVCDFIAGMTDRYALALYSQIFIPKPWSVL
ncbi:MAG: deoxyguanosinetriphosphate triphosphohydrolase [Desulfobulbus sp.]|jgi:dGTPase|uniref:deoxyguanosinetriphosphate triphosphohydrolase n=1 Tax=Desulfobulbus sp. TaxID=895 RepID=UPI00284393FA|nr:deoxyguanosinetriphosphate triphosphohydrolase [Desulfobulbus sp.]MDR2549016.1 deoxyguanosinetriphosphate triphosphohydrolase [Desulfobulbus sp.]